MCSMERMRDPYVDLFRLEDLKNFCTELLPKLAKFVWEVPYSVCVATWHYNGGKLHI